MTANAPDALHSPAMKTSTWQGGVPWRRQEFTLYDDRVHVVERRLFGEVVETDVNLGELRIPVVETVLRSELHQVIYGLPGLLLIIVGIAVGEHLYSVSFVLFLLFLLFAAGLLAFGIWKAKKLKGYAWYPSSEGGLGLTVSEGVLDRKELEVFASEINKAIERQQQCCK